MAFLACRAILDVERACQHHRNRRRCDRPFFRPDISPVGIDRARVMRCRRSLVLAAGCCCCCHRCCQRRPGVSGGSPVPALTAALAAALFHHWTDCCRPIRWREGVRGWLGVYVNQATFDLYRCPAGTAALDAVPEAYHNPAAVWWGAFAPSPVMSPCDRGPGQAAWTAPSLSGQQRRRQDDQLGRLRLDRARAALTQVIGLA